MQEYDAIVIGAGHNGLACATALARAGKKILVLEARSEIGGLAAAREFHKGYTAPGILHDTTEIRTPVLDHLGLYAEDLRLAKQHAGVYIPAKEGEGFFLYTDADRTCDALQRFSPPDAVAYREWDTMVQRFRPFLHKASNRSPPRLLPDGPADFFDISKMGMNLRMLGRNDMMELVRILPMCAADLLSEYFDSELLRAALVGPAITGTYSGPWSAGTAALVLLGQCNLNPGITGGPAALVRALERALQKANGEIQTNAKVTQIQVKNDRVCGVTTSTGESHSASTVISGCDPVHTVMHLCSPADLSLAFEDEIRAIRNRGTTAKIHIALDGDFPLRQPATSQKVSRLRIGHSIDELEQAFDAVKYRAFSEVPQLDVWLPSVEDPSLCPEGHHVVSVVVNFAPYDLAGGWSTTSKEGLLQNVLQRLEESAPGVQERIVHSEVLTPVDFEEEFGLTGGHIHHGEHGLDQLFFMRPTPSAAQYKTPLDGLFFCSSGCHPGGGITCAPGALAAKTVLQNM
jgi:phytoene dehydrogenase-like protein